MDFLLVAILLVALHTSPSVKATRVLDAEMLVDSSTMTYTMPESCAREGKTFCFEKGEDYPQEKIEELLKYTQESLAVKMPSIVIDSRQGNSDMDDDCPSDAMEDQPIYYIVDTNDNVRVVVQSPNFPQMFTVRWCKNEGLITSDTKHFLEGTRKDFNFECVSMKMNFGFYVLSEDSDTYMEIAQAKDGIPVCCRCRYNVTNY